VVWRERRAEREKRGRGEVRVQTDRATRVRAVGNVFRFSPTSFSTCFYSRIFHTKIISFFFCIYLHV
jgi:hypothetical protein